MTVLRLRDRSHARWAGLLVALGLVWAFVPGNVPLYDGVGFPDEPYRHVPVRDASLPVATTAQVTLRLANGVNPGGLVANSAERGPQVSFFAPPQAFSAPTDAKELVAAATPIVAERPAPPGTVVSNTYRLTFRAGDVDATLRRVAQAPSLTMRATVPGPPMPVFAFRASPAESWRTLETQRIGTDVFTAKAPGAGEFVLTSIEGTASGSGSGRGSLLVVVGLGLALVVGALVAVRLAARRRA